MELANWASELIKGMINANGTWRDDVSSLGDPNLLFSNAVDLYSVNQFDSALFYLRLAVSMDPKNLRYRKLIEGKKVLNRID